MKFFKYAFPIVGFLYGSFFALILWVVEGVTITTIPSFVYGLIVLVCTLIGLSQTFFMRSLENETLN